MKQIFNSLVCGAILATGLTAGSAMADSASKHIGAAVYNDKDELMLPEGYREWVFIGAPLTPHGLNGGKAGFPEFHHVYVNPDAFEIYQRTGEFAEGTVIVKELVLTQKGDHKDGSKNAPSGRGYFGGEFNGMDVMVKDSKRYKSNNGWGFFNFGHHKPPYMASAPALPAENCASCHTANAGKGMVFKSYYPVLK